MATVTFNLSGTTITISDPDVRISRNSLGSFQFHNATGEALTLTFSGGSPFTQASQTITNGGNWDPTWSQSLTAKKYNYSVAGDTNTTGATGDIDIQTTPLP